ncbi:MAG: hypothetical protein JNM80_02510 [Phycisphaerae bacterium]|nr:hypothetical protein [Phycisphaerae bacterium]
MAAGCACSLSMAQDQVINAQGRVIVQARPASERLNPTGSSGDAFDQNVYNNGDLTPLPLGGYFSFGNTPRVLDDIVLNKSPGAGAGPGTAGVNRTIKKVTLAIATNATTTPTATPDLEFQWFNSFNSTLAAPTPINSGLAGGFRISLAPPMGGWAINTIYFIDVDLTMAPLSTFVAANENGAAVVSIYTAPPPGTALSPEFDVGFYGDGNTIGNSQYAFWFDNNQNGIFETTEGFIATSNPTGTFRPRASIVLSMDANVDSGSCCLPDGTCILANALNCATRYGGVYGGDNSTCATATCIQPGACVLSDGSCILANSAQCTSLAGVYKGDNTTCADAVCSGPVILWNNGPLATGTTTVGGGVAPAGSQWSEAAGVVACSNNIAGFAGGANGPFRLADNFTVPAGETWTINTVDVFAYQTGAATTASPFSAGALNLQIWNGAPGLTTSSVVYGDTTTNRLSGSSFTNIYRIFNNAAGTTRPVWKVTATLTPPAVLTAGTYYVDWQTQANANAAHFAPPVTTRAFRGMPGRNGQQNVPVTLGNDWTFPEETAAAGAPLGCGSGFERVDFPFVLSGSKSGSGPGCTTGPTCYPNCDLSTTVPFLNVNDFVCFNNRFAAAQSLPVAQQITDYTNCDASTTIPILNVNDFICFNNKFAAGCSAP